MFCCGSFSAKSQNDVKKKKTENRNLQDGEGWLESGAADRIGSYFWNLVVQQLEISFTTFGEVVGNSKECSTVDCVRKQVEIWGNLCICSNCKTCTFYLYCFFYTYYSVESSEYIENALYFYILQMNYCHPTRFQLYIISHLGPKTVDRISILTLTLSLFFAF